MKNMKMKKVLSLILSLALTVGCVPAYSITSMAASNEEQETSVEESQEDVLGQIMEKYKDSLDLMNYTTLKKLQKKEGNKKISDDKLLYTNSIFLTYKELIDDYLYSYIQTLTEDQEDYCDEVISEAEAVYRVARDKLDAAEKLSDLLENSNGSLSIKSEYMTALTIMDYLSVCTVRGDVYSYYSVGVHSEEDIPKLQQNIREYIKDCDNSEVKESLNSYYLDLYEETRDYILEQTEEASTFAECAALMAATESMYSEIENEDDQTEIMHYLYGGTDAVTGFFGMNIASLDSIMCKTNVENYYKAIDDALMIYKDYQLKDQVSEDVLKKTEDEIKDYEKQIESIEDVRNIVRSYNSFIKSLEKETGVAYEDATTADINKMSKQVKELNNSYDRSLYSEDGRDELEEIVEFDFSVESAIKKAELNYIYDEMKAEMDKVKTKEEELSALKSTYIKKLKSYLGNKKYNQKKVKKLVSAGVKKINAAKTESQVRKIYLTYKAKIKKAKK